MPFLALLSKVLPHPDLTFVLTTQPDVISKRKKELSSSEIARQVGEYRALSGKHYVHVDVNQSVDATVELVRQILLQKLHARK